MQDVKCWNKMVWNENIVTLKYKTSLNILELLKTSGTTVIIAYTR